MLSQLVEDEGEHGVVEILKYFNVKTVIYMVAESWDHIVRNTLRKSWKKLCPSACDLPDNKIEKEETSENEKELNKIRPKDFMDIFEKN